jgi:hypothetical protein
MIKAAEDTGGLISLMAQRLGCHSNTVRNYIARHPTLKAAIDQEREVLVDEAEFGLRKAVRDIQPWAVGLVLKTLGKDRGYVEKQQIEMSGSLDVSKLSDDELRAIVADKSSG